MQKNGKKQVTMVTMLLRNVDFATKTKEFHTSAHVHRAIANLFKVTSISYVRLYILKQHYRIDSRYTITHDTVGT